MRSDSPKGPARTLFMNLDRCITNTLGFHNAFDSLLLFLQTTFYFIFCLILLLFIGIWRDLITAHSEEGFNVLLSYLVWRHKAGNMTAMNIEYSHIKLEEPLPSFSKHNFLDLLATVATETLKNDKSLIHIKTRPLSRALRSYSYAEVKKMSGFSLLRLFAIPDIDERKKTYRYKCRLLPEECSNIVSNVGNESRAKTQMKNHLLTHVRQKRRDFEKKLFFPFSTPPKQEKVSKPPVVLDCIFLKEHSYSLLSSMGTSPLNKDHDDDKKVSDSEPQQDYSEFLGKNNRGESGSFMDVDGFVSGLQCIGVPQLEGGVVPPVGSEVLCNVGSMEEESKSVSDKEKEAATMAIILLQLKGSNTPLEDLVCCICLPQKRFATYSSLLSHLKSHTGIRAFECTDCSAQFTRQHSLNYHRLIHDNQTRFTCEDCGRKFRHPSHYKEHRRRHTGELPFQCVDCLLRYKTRNTYKRHLRVNHGKILTSLGSVVRLNGPTDENEVSHVSPTRNKISKPPSDGDAGTDSSSSSLTDDEDKAANTGEDSLAFSLKFNEPAHSPKGKGPGGSAKTSSSPVPNFVTDPPLGAITPKKKINPAMISNGVTISKYSDHSSSFSSSSSNIENKNVSKSFKPSSKSAFKTPADIYKRVRNNVEIRKLICFGPEYDSTTTYSPLQPSVPSNTMGSSSSSINIVPHHSSSQTSKVKILKESVETNNKTSAILAEIDGKRVLLIPKNEEEQQQQHQGKRKVGRPSSSSSTLAFVDKPKSKLEECLLYGVQRAKNSAA